MNEPPIPTITVTPEEAVTLVEYQAFLRQQGFDRTLWCRECGERAEPGTGELGWACKCRVLTWRQSIC